MLFLADWQLTFDRTNGLETGRLAEAYDFIRRLDEASPKAKVIRYGTSPQGREMRALLISDDENFEPRRWAASRKPTVFVQNGIHSGEIEGKDATLILAREMLIEKKHSDHLKNANYVIVPVFSLDAHERFGAFNRANQNGPKEMGWRATAQNLNLNRDWMKADAPEMKAEIGLIQKYRPDYFFDNHTTDGADYQYTLTLGIPFAQSTGEATAKFNRNLYETIRPKCDRAGFLTSPYFSLNDQADPSKGITLQDFSPRYSHGYLAAMDRPAMLVETHVLKPYKDRVWATHRVMLEAIDYCITNRDALKAMNRASDARYQQLTEGANVVLSSRLSQERTPFTFLGFEWAPITYQSSGKPVSGWDTSKPISVPSFVRWSFEPEVTVAAPAAYAIPPEWTDVHENLKLHGITSRLLKSETRVSAEVTRFSQVRFPTQPFESRFQPSFRADVRKEEVALPAGTRIYPAAQLNGKLLIHLMEAGGPDSLVKWGSFNAIFEPKEYAADYAMAPFADRMLQDSKLRAEFEERLKDPNFANSVSARLAFFYERSPYFDQVLNRYPVLRIDTGAWSQLQKNSKQ
jgi:hypothetical protein